MGGHLGGFDAARPLANIPLVWMLDRVQSHGLSLPDGWRARFPVDEAAPSVGTTRGWGKLFLFRAKRVVGADPSESLHGTAVASARARECAGAGAGRAGLAPQATFSSTVSWVTPSAWQTCRVRCGRFSV